MDLEYGLNDKTKLYETNKLIKEYEESTYCILDANQRALFDIAKSLAIIADKLSEVDNKTDKGE